MAQTIPVAFWISDDMKYYVPARISEEGINFGNRRHKLSKEDRVLLMNGEELKLVDDLKIQRMFTKDEAIAQFGLRIPT